MDKPEPEMCAFECDPCNRIKAGSFITEIEGVDCMIICVAKEMTDSSCHTVYIGGPKHIVMATPAIFKLMYHEDGDDFNHLLDNLDTLDLTKHSGKQNGNKSVS